MVFVKTCHLSPPSFSYSLMSDLGKRLSDPGVENDGLKRAGRYKVAWKRSIPGCESK